MHRTIFSLLYDGFKYIFQSKMVREMLGIVTLIIYGLCLLYGGFKGLKLSIITSIVLFVFLCFISGIIYFFKTYDFRKKQEFFSQVFQEIKLIGMGGQVPLFFGEDENEYYRVYGFKTVVPLKNWIKVQDQLETYFNIKIAKISNDGNNFNIIHIYAIKKDLPTRIMWKPEYILPNEDQLILGIDVLGTVYIDLNEHAHSFIAGATGCGKSNILKCLITQCIDKEHDIKLIDFKRGVAFSVFENVTDIITDYETVRQLLIDLVQETNKRLDMFRINHVEDFKEYNALANKAKIKRIIVFIDELAELMRSSDKEANKAIIDSLETITRTSRAAGINLIMGTQRPDSTIINGQIKSNVILRVCGHFSDPEPSRIMLNSDLAANLPMIKGRFILKTDGYREFQAYGITRELMKDVVSHKPIKQKTEQYIDGKLLNTKDSLVKQNPLPKLNFNFDDII